jgi:hypothetical protein
MGGAPLNLDAKSFAWLTLMVLDDELVRTGDWAGAIIAM